MSKCLRLTLLAALLVVFACSTAFAVTFPTVEYMGFDPGTYTYTYKVTQPAVPDCIYALDSFEIDGWMETATTYSMAGPFIGSPTGPSWNWNTRWTTWMPGGKKGYEWYAQDPDHTVWPGAYLSENWVGYFKLTVPNSQPLANGDAITRQSDVPESEHSNLNFMAPNPVPEPGSITALVGLLVGVAVPFIRRRRG